MTRVNVYAIHEFRPEKGTYDFYSLQSTLEDAAGFYAERNGLQVPLDSDKIETDEGTQWRFHYHSGGYAVISRYEVPIVETVDED